MNKLRLIFALLAAVSISGAEVHSMAAKQAESTYQVTDPANDDFGQSGTRAQIEDSCPGSVRECALEQGVSEPEVILWSGATNKF